MKYFFIAIAIMSLWGGLAGNYHLFCILIMCIIMTTAIHLDDKKSKKKTDFFD